MITLHRDLILIIMKFPKLDISKNSQRLIIAILSVVSMIGLLVIQVNWLVESINMQEAIFSRGVNMALQQTAKTISQDEKLNLAVKNTIRKDTIVNAQEYYAMEAIAGLESALLKELKQYHINLAFHMLLINGNDTLSIQPVSKIKNNDLFRHSFTTPEPGAEIELAIHFPGRNSFILKKTGIMFVTSVFLILFTIAVILTILTFYVRERKFAEQIKDMFANVTHEFMTPISSISLAANMLLNRCSKSGDMSAVNLANAIKEENKKLQRQTGRLLQLAEVENSYFEYNKKPVDLHDIINDALNSMKFQFSNAGANIKCDFKASQSVIYADASHLCDVFMNLFINSIKYSTKDPIIKIETENRPGVIVTSITDNGIGIPQKEQKKIFDKYYRITNGDLHNTKGFGIGLYFAKKVVEAHGGNIDVKSEEGFGSTFIISLPLYKIES